MRKYIDSRDIEKKSKFKINKKCRNDEIWDNEKIGTYRMRDWSFPTERKTEIADPISRDIFELGFIFCVFFSVLIFSFFSFSYLIFSCTVFSYFISLFYFLLAIYRVPLHQFNQSDIATSDFVRGKATSRKSKDYLFFLFFLITENF